MSQILLYDIAILIEQQGKKAGGVRSFRVHVCFEFPWLCWWIRVVGIEQILQICIGGYEVGCIDDQSKDQHNHRYGQHGDPDKTFS